MGVSFVEFLEYGVLGLCAITLMLVWRVLNSEQKRDGFPRKGILQASYVFMGFSLALAMLNGYVQLQQDQTDPKLESELEALRVELKKSENELRKRDDKLLQIRSAADPVITARFNIVDTLEPSPEKIALKTLLESLRAALR